MSIIIIYELVAETKMTTRPKIPGARLGALCLCLVSLAGCSPADNANAPSWQSTPAATAGDFLASQCAYELACAACHDEGLNGAPAVGDREA